MSSLARRHATGWQERLTDWAEPLPQYGVENLHRMTPRLLRSAQPRPADVVALQALDVRTVISFRAFNADDEVFHGMPLKLVRVPINTWHIRDRHLVRALAEIRLAEAQGAALIHCMHGADRTGVVAALYRMAMQGWPREAALLEMLHGGYGYHTMWRNIPSYLAGVDAAAIARAVREAAALLEGRQGLKMTGGREDAKERKDREER